MNTQELPTNFLPYLRDRFSLGDILLFTGAGFARSAQNRSGVPFPLLKDLRPKLWEICYPGRAFDQESSVQTLFSTAQSRAGGALSALLKAQLVAAPDGVPSIYDNIFGLPWRKVYTLNVDNIDAIVGTRSRGIRSIRRISALQTASPAPSRRSECDLDVVHLNGIVEDGPAGVTFSLEQYADRLSAHDAFYMQCAADLAAYPAIYIGTLLDESPLWQHMQLRKRGVERSYRKRSFLITPDVDAARAETLKRELGVEHVALDTKAFADLVEQELMDAAEVGIRRILAASGSLSRIKSVPLVSEIVAAGLPAAREYLLGAKPTFTDIRAGRTASRSIATDLVSTIRSRISQPSQGDVLVLCGTAGSGKTTTLMQAALQLDALGLSTAWIDSESDLSPHDILRVISAKPMPKVVIIDDAKIFGIELPNILGELRSSHELPAIVLSCRSAHADRLVDALAVNNVGSSEVVMQNLTDVEIEALLKVLDSENRLGVLKGLTSQERFARFKKKAGSQLIVAMLEATSGKSLKEILVSELDGLEDEAKTVYGMVALSTSLGFGVSLPEILIAVDGHNNRTHRSVEALERRLLINRDKSDDFRVRHPVIAQVLLDAIISDGAVFDLLHGLAVAFACSVGLMGNARSREQRRVRQIVNHDFLFERVQASNAARIYQDLERYLDWNGHYWLQRGSFELEHGTLDSAENFLGQAISLAPGDNLVRTEYGYLRLRQAVSSPSGEASRALLEEGVGLLEMAIQGRHKLDPHQYHILGSQILSWTKRGDVSASERIAWLAVADKWVKEGHGRHSRDEALRQLWVELQNEKLGHA